MSATASIQIKVLDINQPNFTCTLWQFAHTHLHSFFACGVADRDRTIFGDDLVRQALSTDNIVSRN